MTAVTAEASSARDALLACLANAPGPMSRDDISTMTGISLSNVGVVLHRLSRLGLVMAATRGQWELARPEAALAVREPDAVRPAQPTRPRGPAIDGAGLLDGVARYIGHFARFPSRACLDAVTLWAAHAHVRDRDDLLGFGASPRLMLLSSEPGSGKSTVLELLNNLTPNARGLTCEPTEAVLAAKLGQERQTVLLDEADILFGAGKRKVNVRAILNNGYTRNGVWERMRGGKIDAMPVFGAVAIAGLDVMESSTSGNLAAILSRSIIIRMRKPADEAEEIPDITSSPAGAEAGAQGRELLQKWAQVNRDAIVASAPELPEGVRLRAAQIWRPLLAVAGAAGGQWPGRARAACAELATATPEAPAEEAEELTSGFFDALGRLD